MQRSGTEAIRTQLHPSKPKMIYPCNVIINCTLCLHCIGYCRIVIKLADMKEKRMQISGTESIRTQLQPSKLKRKKLILQIVKIQREHMVNRVSSYFPKGGHSATKTELKIIWKHIRRNAIETLTPKQATENHNKNTALERSVMNY